MNSHLSTAAVLILAAGGAWADDLAPLSPRGPDILETRCPEGPSAWAPGLGLDAPKDGPIGQDFLGLCLEKNKQRMPGFPGGAPAVGLGGIVSSDPVDRAKELQLQAEDYSRTLALGKKVGGMAKNPWGDKAEPEAAPVPAAGADLLSPKSALPPQTFRKVPLNSVPALPQRFQVDKRPVPGPAPAAAPAPNAGVKGKICEELAQFVSPKVTWCHPDAAAPQ